MDIKVRTAGLAITVTLTAYEVQVLKSYKPGIRAAGEPIASDVEAAETLMDEIQTKMGTAIVEALL